MWGLPSAQRCSLCGINWPPTTLECGKCGQKCHAIRDSGPDSNEEIERKMDKVEITVARDPVTDWRLSECLRILGLDADVHRAAQSGCDLHALERLTKKAGAKMAVEILA